MILRLRKLLAGLVASLGLAMGMAAHAADQPLRVAVLENSPPMSFRDADGRLTGFSVEIARALCEEMRVRCEFQVTLLGQLLDALAGGEFDIAAVSLLDTPDSAGDSSSPIPITARSRCGTPGPASNRGHADCALPSSRARRRKAMPAGRAQETVAVQTNSELGAPLIAGVAQAAV